MLFREFRAVILIARSAAGAGKHFTTSGKIFLSCNLERHFAFAERGNGLVQSGRFKKTSPRGTGWFGNIVLNKMSATTEIGESAVNLVVLCGLPASGKSNLCNLLQNRDRKACSVNKFCDGNSWTAEEFKFTIVCYDNLIVDPIQNFSETSQWKATRRCVVLAVEQLIRKMTNKIDQVYTETEPLISQNTVEEFEKKIDMLNKIPDELNTDHVARTVIIVDDNMYYRSMRKEYFQLARKYNIGFCQIYLKCGVDEALQRDRRRLNRVGDDIIKNMNLKLEEPGGENYAPETERTFIIDTCQTDLEFCCCELLSFFKNVFRDPVPTLLADDDSKQLSREISLNNFKHQADQVVRKIISELMQSKRDTSSPAQLAEKAAQLNVIRQTILDKIREDRLEIPPDILSAIAKGSLSETRQILRSFLIGIILSRDSLQTTRVEPAHN